MGVIPIPALIKQALPSYGVNKPHGTPNKHFLFKTY